MACTIFHDAFEVRVHGMGSNLVLPHFRKQIAASETLTTRGAMCCRITGKVTRANEDARNKV